MNDPNTVAHQARSTRPKMTKKFFLVRDRAASRAIGMEFLNMDEVFPDHKRGVLGNRDVSKRGFPTYPATPLFRISKKLGRPMNDFQLYVGYWLVSNRTKQILSNLSQEDFEFLMINTVDDMGISLEPIWLCNVIPMLNALDEQSSLVRSYTTKDGRYRHSIGLGPKKIRFIEHTIGCHHAFRLTTAPMDQFCDDFFVDTIKREKLTGFRFVDAWTPERKTKKA